MRRLVASLSALVLALTGALLLAGPSAAQVNQVDVGGLDDKGTITLKTGSSSSSNKIEYKDAKGVVISQQTIGSGCPAPVGSGALVIAASGNACFGNRGFGDGSGGSPFYLNPNVTGTTESLTLKLGGDAAEFEFTKFSLDIEASNLDTGAGIADLAVVPSLDGEQGDPIDVDLNAEPPTGVFANYRVDRTLATPADTLVLKALGTTRFQLEGDTNNTGSIFTLTDITDVVPCQGSASSNGAELTLDGGTQCTPEPVFFEFTDNEVTLLKDPSDAFFTLVVPWIDSSADAAYPGRTTEIDYLDGVSTSGDTDPFDPMVFCVGTPAALPGDQIPSTPGVDDGWCVGDREFPVENGETVTTVETLYGFGDPKMR